MLHTIALPIGVPGALILKDYKLIGIHSGPHQPKPGQPAPPVKVYQMMWMGALFDMSTKKLRSAEDASATGDHAALSDLRTRTAEPEGGVVPQDELKRYICSQCGAANTQVGPCFNCRTMIEPPVEVEPEPTGKLAQLAQTVHLKELIGLAKKHDVTKQHLIIGGCAFLFIILCGVWMAPQPQSATPPATNTAGGDISKDWEKP